MRLTGVGVHKRHNSQALDGTNVKREINFFKNECRSFFIPVQNWKNLLCSHTHSWNIIFKNISHSILQTGLRSKGFNSHVESNPTKPSQEPEMASYMFYCLQHCSPSDRKEEGIIEDPEDRVDKRKPQMESLHLNQLSPLPFSRLA